MTAPQTPKSIAPCTRAAMACTTGTDKVSESRCANGPSTPTKGGADAGGQPDRVTVARRGDGILVRLRDAASAAEPTGCARCHARCYAQNDVGGSNLVQPRLRQAYKRLRQAYKKPMPQQTQSGVEA